MNFITIFSGISVLTLAILLVLTTSVNAQGNTTASTARTGGTTAAGTGGTTAAGTGGTTAAGTGGTTAAGTGGTTATGTGGTTATGTGTTQTGLTESTATTAVNGSLTTTAPAVGGIDDKCGHAAAPLPPFFHPVEIGCTERSPCATSTLGPHSFCCRHALPNGNGGVTIQTACLSAGPPIVDVDINDLARNSDGQSSNIQNYGRGNMIYYRG